MIDPDATPDEKLRTWLAEQEAVGAMRRRPPSQAERWRSNAHAALALAGVIGVVLAIGWLRGWR